MRGIPLRALLCVLLLSGCAAGGPQGGGNLDGGGTANRPSGSISETTLFDLAAQMRADGDLRTAVGFYRRAILLDPGDIKLYLGLGDTLLAAGDANQAAETFRVALKHAPGNPEAEAGLGAALVSLDKPANAIEVLNKAVKAKPSARGYAALGVAWDLLDNSAAAEKNFHAGLTLAPNDLGLLNDLGLSQAIEGHYEAAITTLRRVASNANATARDRLNLALALGLAGQTDDAAQVARIDLDDRAVQVNLTYYAELRTLSPAARAAAILHPSRALALQGGAKLCNAHACSAVQNGEVELSAVQAAPVVSETLKPLAASRRSAPQNLDSTKRKTWAQAKTKETTKLHAANATSTTPEVATPTPQVAAGANLPPDTAPTVTAYAKNARAVQAPAPPMTAKNAVPSAASEMGAKDASQPAATIPASTEMPQPNTPKEAAARNPTARAAQANASQPVATNQSMRLSKPNETNTAKGTSKPATAEVTAATLFPAATSALPSPSVSGTVKAAEQTTTAVTAKAAPGPTTPVDKKVTQPNALTAAIAAIQQHPTHTVQAANAAPQPSSAKEAKKASSKNDKAEEDVAKNSQNANPAPARSAAAPSSPAPITMPPAPASPAQIEDAPARPSPHVSAFGVEQI